MADLKFPAKRTISAKESYREIIDKMWINRKFKLPPSPRITPPFQSHVLLPLSLSLAQNKLGIFTGLGNLDRIAHHLFTLGSLPSLFFHDSKKYIF
jgi:hypothetical protein